MQHDIFKRYREQLFDPNGQLNQNVFHESHTLSTVLPILWMAERLMLGWVPGKN